MAATVAHPTQADLEAFMLGKLDDPSMALVEAHLQECTSCQAQAAAVPGDTFVGLLTAVATRRTSSAAVTPPAAATSDTLSWQPSAAASPAAPPPELADHPRYRLLRLLGAGGMGEVWLAEHKVMNRDVAVKVIRPEFLSQPGAAERFRHEVHAAARLSHPNIVTAFDAEQAGDAHLERVPTPEVPGVCSPLHRLTWEGIDYFNFADITVDARYCLATSIDKNRICIWETQSGNKVRQLAATEALFTPDRTQILTRVGTVVHVHELAKGRSVPFGGVPVLAADHPGQPPARPLPQPAVPPAGDRRQRLPQPAGRVGVARQSAEPVVGPGTRRIPGGQGAASD
jgi:hypothetical protein